MTPAVDDLRHDGDRYAVYRHDATTDVQLDLPAVESADLTVVGWLPNSRLVAVGDDGHLLVLAYGDRPQLWTWAR